MHTAYTLIDPNIIQENLMGNNDLIRQFLQLYETQIPVDFAALEKAVASGLHAEISSKAHHIKPTMEYIGAGKIRKELQELETAAKNEIELTQVVAIFEQLKPQFTVLLTEIKQYLSLL